MSYEILIVTDTKSIKQRGRPRKLDHDAGLKVALSMFQKYGFKNVSIAQLCEQLNATPTSLYATYGNKESLFIAALNLYKADFFRELDRTLGVSENSSDMFRNTMEFTLNYYLDDNKKTGCLILQGNTFCKQTRIIDAIKSSQLELQSKIQNRLNELGSASPDELTQVLITLMQGMALSSQSEVDEDQLYTSLEFFCAAFDC